MANPKKKRSAQSLIPSDPVGEERQAFRKAVRKTRPSGTANDPTDDVLFDDSSSTASASKKPKKLATGPLPGVAENIVPVKPVEEITKSSGSFSFAMKVIGIILSAIGGVIAIVYFFSGIGSQITENATNILNLEKNVTTLKGDLKERIDKIETRLDGKITSLESKLDQKLEIRSDKKH